MRRALALLAVSVAAGCGGSDARSPDARILFIGNSLTFTNDLPAMVAAIGRGTGTYEIEHRMIALPSYSLDDHWRGGGARAALANENWDAVVMQEGPSRNGRVLGQIAKKWADAVRARGATPALMTVWPPAWEVAELPYVGRAYEQAAVAADAALLPAGNAWYVALRRDAAIALYGDDAFHPSEIGTYLAALVVYAGMTGGAGGRAAADSRVGGEPPRRAGRDGGSPAAGGGAGTRAAERVAPALSSALGRADI